MLEDKNTMEHQYNEDISKEILSRITTDYLAEFQRLSDYLSAQLTHVFS